MNSRWRVSFLFMSALLVACSPLAPIKQARITRYELNAVSTAKLKPGRSHATLLVSIPTASPGYQTAGMIYLTQPYQLQTYSEHRWVAAPAQMFLPLLTQSLQNADYFHAVVSPPFVGLTDYRLDTHILALHQSFIQRPSKVNLVVQAELVRVKDNKIIASERFRQVLKAPYDSPQGDVVASNQAAARMLKDITAFTVGLA